MNDSTVPLAAIALVGTILGVVVTPLFKLLRENTKALNALVGETKSGNDKAETRNGHLGDQNIKLAEMLAQQNSDVADIKTATELTAKTLSKSALIAAEDRDILTGGTQVVHEQTVEHQTINNQETI